MGEEEELKLIRESITNPESEEKAKELFLKRLYEEVAKNYTKFASNGGEVAELPECVVKGSICPEDTVFTYNALRVLYSRYLSRNSLSRIIETPSMVMKRVALGFKDFVDVEKLYRLLIERRFIFNSPTLFNMYCNGAKGALSACYVTPVYDDMRSIMEGTLIQAMTFKYGGGQGFSFSNLRPKGALVRGTGGFSSGPISFMRIYDIVTDAVKQGGKRRGANMGILHDWHPDIYNPSFDIVKAIAGAVPYPIKEIIKGSVGEENLSGVLKTIVSDPGISIEEAGFVQVKRGVLGDIYLTNFNISVGVHDAFMIAVLNNDYWWMVDPEFSDTTTGVGDYRIHYAVSRATGLGRLGKILEDIKTPFISILEDEIEKSLAKAKTVIDKLGLSVDQKNPYAWRTKARLIWREIVRGAWESGDPGILYLDNHNKWNPTPWLGAVAATNPCGEQPLYPFESCNLGSMSIEKYVNSDGRFDVEKFAEDVAVAVDAMDAVIDLNKHPDEKQTIANKFTRKIGLGIMGLADALAKLGYPYDSEEAVAFTLAVMAALEVFSWKRSWELGKIRGSAPAFSCRVWDWRNMVCLEEGKPEELVEIHTPAFVKASMVARFEDGWLKVRYHDVKIPQELINALYGEAKNRVEPDGTVKLVRLDALKKILRDVFNIDEKVVEEALKMSPENLVNSPRHLLALTIFEPGLAWERLKEYGRRIGAVAPRNTVTTTVAPTGSISIIAGTSSGIEPYFAIVYRRVVAVGDFLEVVRLFRDKLLKLLDEAGVDRSVAEEIFDVISRNKGSVRKSLSQIVALLDLPDNVVKGLEELAKLFPTTLDIDPWYHLAHQAVAQLYVDQSISKTVNLPKNAPERAVETVFIVGWLLGLKGITIYRDESKTQQVIQFGSVKGEKKSSSKGFRLGQESVEAGVTGSKTVTVGEEGEVVVDQDTNSTCLTCEV